MKLKYLLTAFVAGMGLMTACTETFEPSYWDEIRVSSSYVAISQDGGSADIELTATDSWSIENGLEWLTISPLSGDAGTDITVTFSAEADLNGRYGSVTLTCAGKTQIINVLQGLPVATTATCAEVLNGVDGKQYQVTGICTAIANTNYGNWYINDGTGEVYVYGTVDEKGDYNWSSFDIEVGDEVTVLGPRKTYNGTIELEDVTVVSVNKSLIGVEEISIEDATLPIEGGEITVYLKCKGQGVTVNVPEEAKSWLSIAGVVVDTDAETAEVTFLAAENPFGDREVLITFVTTDGSKEYTAETTILQKGAIIEATAAEINAAEDGSTIYRVTGMVSEIKSDVYGNMYIRDYTGDVYVYGTLDAEGNTQNFSSLGIKVGDIVTVTGPKTSYKGDPQLKNVTVEVHYPVSAVSVADFLATEQDGTWYSLTGTVSKLTNTTYGNFDIVDETGSVYVYGVLPGWGSPKGQWSSLGVNEGDTITIIGNHSSYNGADQVGNAFYVSHVSASADVPAEGETITFSELYGDAEGQSYDFENGVEYEWGTLTMTSVTVGTNPNRYWISSGEVRMYTDGSITLNAGERTMTSIEFELTRGTFTASVGEMADGVWTGEASEVTFTVDAGDSQTRFKSITVTYAE